VTDRGTGRRLRLLHLAAGRGWGGRQMQAMSLMEGLAARGHHVVLAARSGAALLSRAAGRGIGTVPLPPGWPGRLLALRRVVRGAGADVVHLHDASSLVDAARATIGLARAPFVLTVGGDGGHGDRVLPRRLPLARVAHFWASSEWVWSALVRGGIAEERISVLHTAVDLERFSLEPARAPAARQAARDRLGLPGEAFVAGAVLRLSDESGFAGLVSALRMIRTGEVPPPEPSMRLVIIGEGPRRAAFERSLAADGLSEAVVMTGWVDDVADLLPALDVYVHPCPTGDGFPVSLREAMAMGLPCVATDLTGIREIIDNGRHGLIVPRAGPEALARNIMKLRRDPELARRIGHAGSLKVQRYGARAMVDRAEELYFRLVR